MPATTLQKKVRDSGIELLRLVCIFLIIAHHYYRWGGYPAFTWESICFKECMIDSKYIEIELTEASDYEDKVAMQKFVNQLRQNDISVSIDDFGTGYSTFNALKDLNVNIIKLDIYNFSCIYTL